MNRHIHFDGNFVVVNDQVVAIDEMVLLKIRNTQRKKDADRLSIFLFFFFPKAQYPDIYAINGNEIRLDTSSTING